MYARFVPEADRKKLGTRHLGTKRKIKKRVVFFPRPRQIRCGESMEHKEIQLAGAEGRFEILDWRLWI
jgi:hypothetical protein